MCTFKAGCFHENINLGVWSESLQSIKASEWKPGFNEVRKHVERKSIHVEDYIDFRMKKFLPRYGKQTSRLENTYNIVVKHNKSATENPVEVEKELWRLADTGAIRLVGELEHVLGQQKRIYSPLSVIIKPGKVRVCIDAVVPNAFAKTGIYLCEYQDLRRIPYTFRQLPNAKVQIGDLVSYFHHFKISEKAAKLFSFIWKNKVFEYTILPFGFCLSPYFAQYTHEVIALTIAKKLNAATNIYLDDFLIIGEKERIIKIYQEHGFQINAEKSSWDQDIKDELKYLGVLVNLQQQYYRMLEDKAQTLIENINEFTAETPEQSFHKGNIEKFSKIVGKITYYSICLQTTNKKFSVSLLGKIASWWRDNPDIGQTLIDGNLEKIVIEHLRKWERACIERERVYFTRETGEEKLQNSEEESIWYVDASDYAAAIIKSDSEQMWRYEFRGTQFDDCHINIKELYILVKALELLQNREELVHIFTDSRAAKAWVEKSKDLIMKTDNNENKTLLLHRAYTAYDSEKVKLTYVPTAINQADVFSRKITAAEWELTPTTYRALLREIGWENINIDATAAIQGNIAQENWSWETNIFEQKKALNETRGETMWLFPPKNITLRVINWLRVQVRLAYIACLVHQASSKDIETIMQPTPVTRSTGLNGFQLQRRKLKQQGRETKNIAELDLVLLTFQIDNSEQQEELQK